MVEYEVKLTASRKVLERIENDAEIVSWNVVRLSPIKLVSHYYDTEDFKLLFNNFAFRLREEGSRKLLTLKSNGIVKDGIYVRQEHEVELDHENFLSKSFLRKHFPSVYEVIKNDNLVEVLTIVNYRHPLLLTKNHSELELDLDYLYFVKGKKKVEYYEVEIELKKGRAEDLIECMSLLQEKYNLKFSGASKYELGLRCFNEIPCS
ncbi:MAG: CYTH domain-containing protein [Caldisericaceae bacterium]